MPGRQYLTRLITVRYLMALALIALIVTASVVVTGMAIRMEREGYLITGMASEQRLASQRIPFLANAYVNATDPEMREIHYNALRRAISNAEKRHKILTLSTETQIPKGMREILRDVYLDGPRPFKAQMDHFLESARAVLAAAEGDLHRGMPHLVRLNIGGGGFLLNTHAMIVNLLRKEENAALDRIYRVDKALWAVTLILLAAEVPLIFQPMVRRASKALAEMQEARLQAEKAAAAAEAAREGQASFIRTMSHELRTPLNAILGMNQLMRMRDLQEKRVEYADDIDRAGRHLLGLIDDLLELGRLEAKQVEVRKGVTTLKDELERTLALLQPLAAGKGLSISYRLDPALAGHYRADGLRIQQVLVNIAGNAIKFTHKGSVCLRVIRAGSAKADADLVRFEIEDTGIGVPPGAHERIFQEFQQADTSLARRYGGSGLGLAISSKLVALMGGEIGVESPDGGGSVFWFTLPLERSAEPCADGEESAARTVDSSMLPAAVRDQAFGSHGDVQEQETAVSRPAD